VAIYACELPPAKIKHIAKKRVVLWGQEDMLGASVEYLLNISKNLNLIKISDRSDVNSLIEQVENTHPDVIVIHQADYSDNQDLPMRLMQNQSWLKVIIVNLENNSVEVFNKQKVSINEGSDLLSIVEGCPRLPCINEQDGQS